MVLEPRFSTALALRRNWGNSVRIIAIDTNPKYLVTSSLISDDFFQVPETIKPEFKTKMEKILEEENVDTYIPFIDHEIFIAAQTFEEGIFKKKLNLQVKNSIIADICNDKYKTFLWLSENNILTPECFNFYTTFNDKENLIIKPRRGGGSQVKIILENKSIFSNYNTDDYIIQPECKKPEITIDVCYDKKRNYFSFVCRERIEVKSGVCTKARLFYDRKLERIAFLIAYKLDLISFCFQVMKYNEDWAVTDINARLGGGTAMSVAAGMDFFSGMIAILWGEDPSEHFKPFLKERYVTRQYSEFVMNF